jgi:hypothetical protein
MDARVGGHDNLFVDPEAAMAFRTGRFASFIHGVTMAVFYNCGRRRMY